MIIRHYPMHSMIESTEHELGKIKRMIKFVKNVKPDTFSELKEFNEKKFYTVKVFGTTQTERSMLFSDARDSVKTFE